VGVRVRAQLERRTRRAQRVALASLRTRPATASCAKSSWLA
jgi:hypothetical protein